MLTFLEELEEKNISVFLNGNDLEINFDGEIDEHTLAKLKKNKQDLISFLKKYKIDTEHAQIPLLPKQEYYQISNAQRRLWIVSQDEENSRAYNLYNAIKVEGVYDKEILEKAIMAVIHRHEILRTVFVQLHDGEIRQKVLDIEASGFQMKFVDFTKEECPDEKALTYIQEDSRTVFDLAKGPLIRVALIQTSENKQTLYYNMHHIISDGWSMEVLFKDFMASYSALEQEVAIQLPELNIQYKDYAAWQLSNVNSDKYADYRIYWTNRLGENLPLLDLPTSKSRPKMMTYNGRSFQAVLPADITKKMKEYAQQEQGSIFITLLSTLYVLFHKYTAQNDLIIGTGVAGRSHTDLEDQIGFYVNTLVLRNQIHAHDTFDEFYQKVKTQTLRDFSNQEYPFDKLVEDLNLTKDSSRNTLFDVMLVLQNETENDEDVTIDEHTVNSIIDIGVSTAKFDLMFDFEEIGNYMTFQVTYNTDVYELEMIKNLMMHYKQLLTALFENTASKIEDVDYVSVAEKNELLYEFNATTTQYPKEKTIVDLFVDQVKATPNQTAIIDGTHTISYQKLEELSNSFAQYLSKEHTVEKGDFIGIKLERTHHYITTLLGILKLGATYVPIDHTYPEERIAHMQSDSNCKVIIDQELLTKYLETQDIYTATFAPTNTTSDAVAYVMYTSGSTGIPKGVTVTHQNIIRLVKSANFYQFSGKEVLLSTGSFSFDATTFEFFGTLLNGATLVITSKDTLLDSEALSKMIKTTGTTTMWFTAGWLNQLVDTKIELFSSLQTVLAGGDKLSPKHIAKLRSNYSNLELINGYGPTENTTFSLTYSIKEVQGDIPIGYPISNSTVYILDNNLNLVPKGVTGELYLGGDGLAKGYLDAKLTNEKFIKHPFIKGERLYKTGDLGKWTSDGSVIFMGRADNQVKINGYRIELGEIKKHLEHYQNIDDTFVTSREDNTGAKSIVAYIVASETLNIADITENLTKKLPVYMIPAHYVQMETLPLNGNGKVDRDALPLPDKNAMATGVAYVPARNETDQKIIAIWEEHLGREKISIKDDFFQLGGHSLNALTIISKINQEFELNINIKNLFLHTTIESLGSYIDFMLKQQKIKQETENINQIEL